MKIQRKDSADTRHRLLEAAAECFAKAGFKDTTIAEICEKAGTNVASVNYHFGDKESLYKEAWRHSFRESLLVHPPDGGVLGNASPQDRLRGRISAMLQRCMDAKCMEFRIMSKEIANPTGLLREVVHEAIMPLRRDMDLILRELLGERVPDICVHLCATSVIGQCMHLMHMRRVRKTLGYDLPCDGKEFDQLVDHFTRFSLAGIAAVREHCERVAVSPNSRTDRAGEDRD